MSSTSVHSRKEIRNYHINCGQTIANKEGRIEVPPKTAKRGPSTLDIEPGLAINIPVETSVLREDGKLVAGGRTVATFPPEAYRQLDKKKAKNREADKGNDR